MFYALINNTCCHVPTSFSSKVHAGCQVTTVFENSCSEVQQEITSRLNGNLMSYHVSCFCTVQPIYMYSNIVYYFVPIVVLFISNLTHILLTYINIYPDVISPHKLSAICWLLADTTGQSTGAWSDPHNNGTYTLLANSNPGGAPATWQMQRVTGDQKYTDLINFVFSVHDTNG